MLRRTTSGVVGLAVGALVIPLALSTALPASGHEGHGGAGGKKAAGAFPDAEFQKVTLNDRPGEPMDLAVLPDSSVLHTTRSGVIWHNDASTGVNSIVGRVDVYQHDEEGLQSIALDPGYNGRSNKWVYLYYSPPQNTPKDDPTTPGINEGDAPEEGTAADFAPYKGVIRLSRFKFDGTIRMNTEQVVLDVPIDRGICCHVGGDIVFDSDGNLILATGDDTNPFQSDGFVPLDDRPGRNPAFDARRTSGNTNDLRGKLLRIKVKPGGGYTIPRGNLFPPGTAKTLPEIYAMGFRNPFRIEIDPDTDDVWVADYSPDSRVSDPDRGPAGTGKWVVVGKPSNYGWPFCATDVLPYNDYDFATEMSGPKYDCAHLVNDSAHNTGLTQLPPTEPAEIWYEFGPSAEFPGLGTGGIGPMSGPALQFDPADRKGKHPIGWPRHYDDLPLLAEWTRDWIKGIHLDGEGGVSEIESVVPGIVVDNPMDLEFGPDGALYVLEYGDGFFAENPDAQLSRIDYIGPRGNHTPQPKISSVPAGGQPPLTVQFSSDGTVDADGDQLSYYWDFDGDGRVDSTKRNPTYTYRANGTYRATLTVKDRGGKHRGKQASADLDILVGNQPPVVKFVTPVRGQAFHFGDTVTYEVTVTDDTPVDCSKVEVSFVIGHDSHGHPMTTANGCTGQLVTSVPGGHDPELEELNGVFIAQYTDSGPGVPLTGLASVVLQPTD